MGIISGLGSFRGRFWDHFKVGDHFGVGIISGAVQASKNENFIDQTDHYFLVPKLRKTCNAVRGDLKRMQTISLFL